jgi:hypothetical protein
MNNRVVYGRLLGMSGTVVGGGCKDDELVLLFSSRYEYREKICHHGVGFKKEKSKLKSCISKVQKGLGRRRNV